jgi:phage/plasmid primase-like uncharacterized protein
VSDAIKNQFLAAMATRGLSSPPDKELVADGKWHRCDTSKGGAGNSNGSYLLCLDGPAPQGFYQNWQDGEGVSCWRGDRDRPLTESEQAELERYQEQKRKEYEEDAAARRKDAARTAQSYFTADVQMGLIQDESGQLVDIQPALEKNPYVQRKGITLPLRELVGLGKSGNLWVPMFAPGEDRPVNVQFINDDGSKFFLTGGQTNDCYFVFPGDPGRIILTEGFATGASIAQATGATVVVTFSARNLPRVASIIRRELEASDARLRKMHEQVHEETGVQPEQPRRYNDTVIIIAADDDWRTEGNPGLMAGIRAARAADALITVPIFGPERKDKQTDFNDLACVLGADVVRVTIDSAIEPDELVKNRLLADPHAAFNPVWVQELAGLKQRDPSRYERLRSQLMKGKDKVRASALDPAIAAEIARTHKAADAKKTATPPPPDIDALAKSAKEIIGCPDVLDKFDAAFGQAYAGEQNNAKLLYLVATSRLFDDPMHAAVKGTSSVGKSALMERVLEFIPPEAIITFTALSEKALIYMPEGFEHKIISMAEASDSEDQKTQDYLMRSLMSEKRLHYYVSMKVDGEIQTVLIEKKGPVSFVVTTTKNKLNPENETRMLSLELDDSQKATRKAMAIIAIVRGLNMTPGEAVDFGPWRDFQRWLAAGERRVVIDFAPDLAELIPPVAVRVRRDLVQIISAIKAHALLHREARERLDDQIVATIEDDYAAIRPLVASIVAEAAEIKVSKEVRETVEAVKKVQDPDSGATVRAVKDSLKVDRSTARRRLHKAEDISLVVNPETRPRRPGRYKLADTPAGSDTEMLPTVEKLRAAFDAANGNVHEEEHIT